MKAEWTGQRSFKLGDHEYSIMNMNTFDQFDIARRLAPVCSMLSLQTDKSKLEETFPRAFCSLTVQISKDDMLEIHRLVFSHVLRKQGDQLTPIYHGGQFAFADIQLTEMLKIMWAVLEVHRMVDFFAGSLSDLMPLQT